MSALDSRWSAVSTLVLVALLSRPSAGEEPSRSGSNSGESPGASEAQPEQSLTSARVHFQQGIALFRERNFDAALSEFSAAYQLSGEPVALYNIGLTNKELLRYPEAIDSLKRYLREAPVGDDRSGLRRRAEVQRTVAEMESLLAEISFDLQPATAVVRVDGRLASLSSTMVLRLAAGTHRLEATADGFESGFREIVVVAGNPQRISFILKAVPRTGHVRILTSQGTGEVAVDGRPVGRAPVEVELPPGGHEVEVSAQGFQVARSELLVAVGQSREVRIRLEAIPPPKIEETPLLRRWWVWSGVFFLAAAGGAAIYLSRPDAEGPLQGSLGAAKADP